MVLVPNLLHSFDRPTNELLLKRVYDALAPNGRIAVVEFAPGEDQVSPRIPALFALIMLANNSGDAYTVSEQPAMLTKAGFSDCEAHPRHRRHRSLRLWQRSHRDFGKTSNRSGTT